MNQTEKMIEKTTQKLEAPASRLSLARVLRLVTGARPSRECARLLPGGALLERDGRTWSLDGRRAEAPARLLAPLNRLFEGLRLSALRLEPGVKGYEIEALRELLRASAARLMDLKLDEWLAQRGVRRLRLRRDPLAAACHDLAAELNQLRELGGEPES